MGGVKQRWRAMEDREGKDWKRGRERFPRDLSPFTSAGDPHRSKNPVLFLGHGFSFWLAVSPCKAGQTPSVLCSGPARQLPRAVLGASGNAPAVLKGQEISSTVFT